jgi:hypothetical protein
MKAVLAASLIAFVLLAAPAASFATETGATEADSVAVPDGEPAPPSTTEGKESASEQIDSDSDVMKNFTRHRPGACPEGPPCKVED